MYQIETLLKVLFLTSIVAACGGTGNSDLSIGVSSNAFIIPAGSISDACYGGTVAAPAVVTAPFFSIAQITTTWKGSGTFLPVLLQITTNNQKAITVTCNITSSSGNISSQLGFNSSNPNISKGSATYISGTSQSCPLICGSVNVVNPKSSVTVSGTVKLFGIQTVVDSNNNPIQKPVTAQASFTLQNIRQ